MRTLSALILLSACGLLAAEPYPADMSKVEAAKPEDRKDVEPKPAPEGAVVLFDGSSLDGWVTRTDEKKPAEWKIVDGKILQGVPGKGDIVTAKKFDGHLKLHVEFRVPYEPEKKGQGRGNSGVYLQGRYEVQVLDSYGIAKPGEGDCGGIYTISKPLVNACKLPAVWQSYDIDFLAPTFKDGKKTELGVITVEQNGVKIHDNVKLTKDVTTSGMATDPSTPGPILLQDHGHPVQYRNIWLVQVKE